MKIELTEEQFARLIKLAYLGNHLVNDMRDGGTADPRITEYDETEEALLKAAYEHGYKDWVFFDEKLKKHFPTRELEFDSEIDRFIEEYNEDIFWEELGIRLAERDIMEEYGEEIFSRMEEKERKKILAGAEKRYFDELERNGIDNLRIVDLPGSEDTHPGDLM